MKQSKRILNQIIKNERELSQNDYCGKTNRHESFVTVKGKIPVLISAPHGVTHQREGKAKPEELYTGGIAKTLQELTGCFVIYKSKNDTHDPNFEDSDHDGGYKDKIVDIIRQNKIIVLIDLHGADESRAMDIDLGTNKGKTLNDLVLLPKLMQTIFLENRITNVTIDSVFSANRKSCISNYVSQETGIPCIQVEVNRRYRRVEEGNMMSDLVNSMEKVINAINKLNPQPSDVIVSVGLSDQHNPRDNVVISSKLSDELDLKLNDRVVLSSLTTQYQHESTIKKVVDSNERKIFLTNHLTKIMGLSAVKNSQGNQLLLRKQKCFDLEVRIQKVGVTQIAVSKDIYSNLDKLKKYAINNVNDGIYMQVDELIVNQDSRNDNSLFLNHYQRQLINVNLPKKAISLSQMDFIKNHPEMTEPEIKYFLSCYSRSGEKFVINKKS